MAKVYLGLGSPLGHQESNIILALDRPDLAIPHPRLAKRAFVLFPLAEIAPELVHPVLKLSAKALVKRVGREEQVRLVGGDCRLESADLRITL